MREYDLEEILAEYAEENVETAQPEEEAVPPRRERTPCRKRAGKRFTIQTTRKLPEKPLRRPWRSLMRS